MLAAERDQQATIAAAAERARIARELHDVVAHSLSVVIAQADGGRYAARQDPSAAVAALHTIATTAREAQAEMRRALGILGDRSDAPMQPQPGVGELGSLVARTREAGLAVELIEEGRSRPLAPAAGVTLYRVAQEALTNVLKHAGPEARASVALRWEPERVTLVVRDDGSGAGAAGDGRGRGLVGMRERVEPRDGTLTAGPHPDGGFEVRAELPAPRRRPGSRRERRHPDLPGRRPVARPRGPQAGDRLPGRHDRRGRGGRRPRGARGARRDDDRHRADGRADARARRRRDDRPADRARGRRGTARGGADHVRPRRVRVLRDRAPAPAASCSRTPSRRSSSRRSARSPPATPWWRPARPGGCSSTSPTACPVHDATTRGSRRSPTASGPSCWPSRVARPTRRSAPSSTWPRPPSRPTSDACWPSSTKRDRVQLVVFAYESGLVHAGA